MKRNVSVVRFKFRFNILISDKIIKEMPGSVASGTPCISYETKKRHFTNYTDTQGRTHIAVARESVSSCI